MKQSLISRLSALILSAVFILAVCCSSNSFALDAYSDTPSDTMLVGDVNFDKKINTGDCIAVLKHCCNIQQLDVYGRTAADVNCDSRVNTGDASILLMHTVNLGDSYAAHTLMPNTDAIAYTAVPFNNEIELGKMTQVTLCEYTALCMRTPFEGTTLGVGLSIELTANTRIVFETLRTIEDIDTTLYVLDSANNILAYDDDSGDSRFSRIEYNVLKSGEYHIIICSDDLDEVGSCGIYAAESVSFTPPATPGGGPMELPTITLPAGVTFVNGSLPQDNAVLQYGSSYTLTAAVKSKLSSIIEVRAIVYNQLTSEIELSGIRLFDSSQNMREVSFTQGGSLSLDNKLAFSKLSFGKKILVVYCTTSRDIGVPVYAGEFFVGATDNLLAGNAFTSGSAELNSSQRARVINHLNALDETAIGTKAIMNAFAKLGTPYGTGAGELDCSSTVQGAYAPLGVDLPRTAAEQGRFCYNLNGELSVDEIVPGDLVFFTDTGCSCGRYREIHHVSIYVGTIDGVRYYLEESYSKQKLVLRIAWGESGTGRYVIPFYGRPY